MRAMALVLAILCWSVQHVWAELDQSSSSIRSVSELLASSTAHGQAKPDDSGATPLSSSKATDSHSSSRPASVTPSSKSHEPTRGASPDGGTHRPHLVTLSSTTVTVHPMHPTSFPSPEQAPHPMPPQRPQPAAHHAHHGSNGGLIAGIVFGVLGGLAGFFALFTFARCLHSWRRTPARDRIRTMMDRHYLEREMEEREREDIERRVQEVAAFRRPSLRGPPPPPYQPAPAYDVVVGEREDAAMMSRTSTPSATPDRMEFPLPDVPPPAATSQSRVDERRTSGDSHNATGPDLV